MMFRFCEIFSRSRCNVIGMIHIGALPGTPNFRGSVQKLIETAAKEAETYSKCSIDGIIIENMHDIPYIQPKDMGPEVASVMTRICTEVRKCLPVTIPCGVQVLAGANNEAIAVALAAGLQFIRAEGFIFSHVADEGFTNASAGTLLRYRTNIGANNVLIFTDIKKKHSAHAITSDVSLGETVKAAEFFQSDGIIITGVATGAAVDPMDLHEVKAVASGPVLVGSGVTRANLHKYLKADAVIVGTHFKYDGEWKNSVDPDRVKLFMEEVHKLQ